MGMDRGNVNWLAVGVGWRYHEDFMLVNRRRNRRWRVVRTCVDKGSDIRASWRFSGSLMR